MAITKQTITLDDNTTKDIYTEITTEIKQQEITLDMVDAQITNNNNTIQILQTENDNLIAKKAEMLAL